MSGAPDSERKRERERVRERESVCVCTSEAVALDVHAGKSCKKSATNVTGDHAKIYSSRGEGGGGCIHTCVIYSNQHGTVFRHTCIYMYIHFHSINTCTCMNV